jgi:hypothetical protein
MRVSLALIAAVPLAAIVGAGPMPAGEDARGGDLASTGLVAQTIFVTIVNQRPIGLAELDAAPAGSSAVEKIVENLAPGRKTFVRLPGGDCILDLYGLYDDGTRANVFAIDLCSDGRINLVP